MRGTIEINGLRLRARHGVMSEERILGNNFELTIHIDYPIAEAMESDDIEATLNYAEAVETAQEVMDEPSALLEHAIGRLKSALLAKWPLISGGYIRLAKLNPPINARMDNVAVSVRW